MSGGSYEYAYSKIDDLADSIKARESALTPLRRAFVEHLHLVSEAAHDIEWVDSGDCGPGDEDKAILAVLGPNCSPKVLALAVDGLQDRIEELRKALELVETFAKGIPDTK